MSNTLHLTEDQLIQAVVDGPEAAEEIRLHLQGCPECRARVQSLEAELGGLAEMAADTIEVPPRPASFAGEPARPARRRSAWSTVIAASLAAAAALVLALLPTDQPPQAPAQAVMEIAAIEDVTISDDIFWEPEEAFSNFDEYIMAADDTLIDQDFLDFVAPDIDETTSQCQAGRKPC